MDPNKAAEQEFGQHEDGLTEEERAALEGAEDQGALPAKDWEREFPQAGDGGATEPGVEHADKDHGGSGDDDDAPGRDDGGDTGAPAAQDEAPPQRPLLVAEVPEGAEERLKAIDEEKARLMDQLDEGDITVREFNAKAEALNDEKGQIQLALHTAQMAEQMERQRLQSEWESTVHAFLRANPDFKKDANPILFNALDQQVREIAASEEGQGLTNAQILERARDVVDQAVGRKPKAPAAQGQPAQPAQSQRPAAPPTLARVPAADMTTSEGEFSHIDRLLSTDPEGYEAAIAAMDDKTRDRYMQAR